MTLCLSSASSSLFTGLAPLQPRSKAAVTRPKASYFFICSCSASNPQRDDGISSDNSGLPHMFERANKHVVKLALAAAVAGLLAFSPSGDALAAKSGGRVGGQAFRAGPPPSAGPRADNSRRTNIFINPPPAPPLFGSPYYGGWGFSPFSFFAPGPTIALSVGGGLNFFGFLLLISIVFSVVNFFRRRNDDDYYD